MRLGARLSPDARLVSLAMRIPARDGTILLVTVRFGKGAAHRGTGPALATRREAQEGQPQAQIAAR